MAITFTTIPTLFTTLNRARFKVTSNRPTIKAFRVQIIDAATSAVLGIQKYAVLPMYPLGTSFDISSFLSSYIDYQIANFDTILEPLSSPYKAYRIIVTELYVDGTGATIDGNTSTSGTFNIINATLSRYDFSSFDYRTLVAGTGGAAATVRFLSYRPRISQLYSSSKNFLYFAQNIALSIKLTFYRRGVGVVGTQLLTTEATNKFYRLNLSPAFISSYFGASLTNAYGQEFTNVFTAPFGNQRGIADVNYFTVQLFTTAGTTPMSELRTYVLTSDACARKITEVVFSNNLGGFDSMPLFFAKQTVSSSKTSIEANPNTYDGSGNYSDIYDGVFNPDNKIIASANQSAFSLTSDVLNDDTSLFCRTLIESDNVYVKMANGNLYPINVTGQDYSISKRKYSTNNERLTLNFTIKDTNFNL